MAHAPPKPSVKFKSVPLIFNFLPLAETSFKNSLAALLTGRCLGQTATIFRSDLFAFQVKTKG